MPCSPLNIQNGLFTTSSFWLNASSANFDGKTLTYNAGGAYPGLSVTQGTKSVFHAQLNGRTVKYMILGSPQKYLVILDIETTTPSTRRVSLVDFSTWTELLIFDVLADSTAALPVINQSLGNGSVFLGYGQNGTEHTDVAIYRSDNGKVLCPLGFSFVPTGQTAAEATATELIIHYSRNMQSYTKSCPKPTGDCAITPALQSFSDVAVGGCIFTPQTRQFTIKNVGDDCLTVTSIADNPPFNITATTPALPATLARNEALVATVAFDPGAVGNWTSSALAVATAPAVGDNKLLCTGKAVSAAFGISFNAMTFNWGSVPVGTSAPPKTLKITNNGSKPLNVSVAPVSSSGFACAGFNGTLNCGTSQSLSIAFTPPAEGPQSATILVTSDAGGSPHTITLQGTGCMANASIVVPPSAPIDFGQIQRGFRTVRLFEVHNAGDGPLAFNGTITGPDAALFGLPDPSGSVTMAPGNRSYDALPVAPCGPGPAGSGKALVAIAFHANDAPHIATATLTLSGHNATNFPAAQSWTFPLTAEITPPVALDVALVVDRSGSMNDALGSRVKLDAAVSASQLFVELLRPDLDDRVAVVRFNHLPDVVVPTTDVSSTVAPTQAQIRGTVQSGLKPAKGNTAIAAGTVTGIREVQKPRAVTPPALAKAVVVLTDGKENTAFEDPAGSNAWFSVLGGQMLKPLPSTGNVTTSPFTPPPEVGLYAVGVGTAGQIDPAQLDALVAGNPQRAFRVDQNLTGTKYFQLEKYFTQIFMDIVDMSTVTDPMFWINAGDTHEIEFDVLRGDVDAMVVIYDWEGKRLPFYCLSPTGEVLDPVSVAAGYQLRTGVTNQARIVEFKMPPNDPGRYGGRWKVVVRHPGQVCTGMPPEGPKEQGFLPEKCREFKEPILYGIAIGVGSNFRMTPFLTPGPVYVGDPIQLTALIAEAGLPVSGCTVFVKATAPDGATSTWTLLDDGAHGDAGKDDGEYASKYTHTFVAGVYHFEFRAVGTSRSGEPVVREALRDKDVILRGRQPGAGDGKPSDRDCCDDLLKAVHRQTSHMERLLKKRKK